MSASSRGNAAGRSAVSTRLDLDRARREAEHQARVVCLELLEDLLALGCLRQALLCHGRTGGALDRAELAARLHKLRHLLADVADLLLDLVDFLLEVPQRVAGIHADG